MSSNKSAGSRSGRAGFVTFLLLVVLAVIGVGITDYAPADAHHYWLFMVFVCAVSSILAGPSRPRSADTHYPVSWVGIQLLHWSACAVAVLIVYSLVYTGRVNNADAGLILLLLLALAVFLDGAHAGRYFYLLGALLAVMTIAMAYIEQFIWFILIASVIALIIAIYWERLRAGRPDRAG